MTHKKPAVILHTLWQKEEHCSIMALQDANFFTSETSKKFAIYLKKAKLFASCMVNQKYIP